MSNVENQMPIREGDHWSIGPLVHGLNVKCQMSYLTHMSNVENQMSNVNKGRGKKTIFFQDFVPNYGYVGVKSP